MEHKTQRTMAKKVFRILFMLLIAVFGIYLAIQFIIIFHRGYKTETAIAYTMADSISLQGVVSFDTVRVDGSGDLGYLVSDGERVTNGTVLAECYTDDSQGLLRERLDRLGRTIDLLSKSQNSSGSDLSLLTSQTRQALYNLLDKLDTAQYRPRASLRPSRSCRPSTTASRPSWTLCRPSPPPPTAISAVYQHRPPS